MDGRSSNGNPSAVLSDHNNRTKCCGQRHYHFGARTSAIGTVDNDDDGDDNDESMTINSIPFNDPKIL